MSTFLARLSYLKDPQSMYYRNLFSNNSTDNSNASVIFLKVLKDILR